MTPLHYAAGRGNHEITELLLEHGANANAKDEYLQTPVHHASMYNSKKSLKLLAKSAADLNSLDGDKQTPLMRAVSVGHLEIVKTLLDLGVTTSIMGK
jgi:ankyrin repeat protein